MKYGFLTYNPSSKRMCIAFKDCIRDLHCGDGFDIYLNGKWYATSVEMLWPDKWYLVGLSEEEYDYMGAKVRTT